VADYRDTWTLDVDEFEKSLSHLKRRQEEIDLLTQKYGKNAGKAYTQAEQAAKRAAAGPSAFTTAIEANTQAATANKASLINLGNQFADLGVQIQAGGNPMTAFIQQGAQIAPIIAQDTALLGAFSSALGVLGAAAAGAVAMGAPLLAWSKALEEQNEKTRASVTALTAANEVLGKGATKVAELQIGLEKTALTLSGQEGVVEGMEAATRAGGAYEDMLQGLNLTLAEHERQLRDVEDGADGFLEAAFGPSGVERAQQADRLKETIAGLRRTIADVSEEQQTAADTAELHALGQRALAEETDRATEALKQQKKLLDEAGEMREARFLRDQELMQEWEDWQREDNETFAKVLAAQEKAEKERWDEGAEQIAKQRKMEIEAAHQSIQLAATRRDALLSVTDTLASSAAEAFGAESAVAKVAAGIQLAIAEVEVLAKAATLGPIAGPIYGALGTAAVVAAGVKLAGIDTDIESYNDTPMVQQRTAGPNGLNLRFAPGDQVEFAAARRPQDLDRQRGGGPTQVSTSVRLVVDGRAAGKIVTSATTTRRGRAPGSPIPGRRSK
jgi:hypothetical protein